MHESIANASLASSSFDRAAGNVTVGAQPYNNFQVQTIGGPIIQGAINRIKVSEIFFPYNVPTICLDRNDSLILSVATVTNTAPNTFDIALVSYGITITPGWYNGPEMQAELQAAFNTAIAPLAAGSLEVVWDPVGSRLSFLNTTTWTPTLGTPNYLFTILPVGTPANLNNPQLFNTIGLRNSLMNYPVIPSIAVPFPFTAPTLVPAGYAASARVANSGLPNFPLGYSPIVIKGAPYSGRYTDWIDICSPILCQAQYVRDSNTNQVAIRKDVLTRLYIADETSMPFLFDAMGNPQAVGSRPFDIHRQFKNAKVIRSNNEISASALNIQLYDMYGLPLPLAPTAAELGGIQIDCGYDDFSITFLVEEKDHDQSHNVGYY